MTGPGRARFVLVLTVVAGAIIGALAWRFFRHAVLPPGFARGNGRIEAVEIDVATKAPGRVREILVEEGDLVRAGQPLANMDTAVLMAQRRQAEAELQRALIGIDVATSQVRQRDAEKQAEMDARLDAGLSTFALDIPPDLQRDVLAGRAPEIQLNVDATRMSQALTGSAYIQTIVGGEVRAFIERYRAAATLPVDLVVRVRFNPELKRAWFGAIMEVINQVTMLSIVLTGAALIREREHGTVEHLLAMPVTPFEIMTSKVWSMALVVLVACVLSLSIVVRGLLAVPIEGAVTLFLIGAAVHPFATTSLGIFLGTIARSMPQFSLLLLLLVLPLQMLSGGVTPRESMPDAVRMVMLAAPTTHFVMLAQAILYRGAGLAVIWPQIVALGAIGAALFSYALTRFRSTIGAMT